MQHLHPHVAYVRACRPIKEYANSLERVLLVSIRRRVSMHLYTEAFSLILAFNQQYL